MYIFDIFKDAPSLVNNAKFGDEKVKFKFVFKIEFYQSLLKGNELIATFQDKSGTFHIL